MCEFVHSHSLMFQQHQRRTFIREAYSLKLRSHIYIMYVAFNCEDNIPATLGQFTIEYWFTVLHRL